MKNFIITLLELDEVPERDTLECGELFSTTEGSDVESPKTGRPRGGDLPRVLSRFLPQEGKLRRPARICSPSRKACCGPGRLSGSQAVETKDRAGAGRTAPPAWHAPRWAGVRSPLRLFPPLPACNSGPVFPKLPKCPKKGRSRSPGAAFPHQGTEEGQVACIGRWMTKVVPFPGSLPTVTLVLFDDPLGDGDRARGAEPLRVKNGSKMRRSSMPGPVSATVMTVSSSR